MAGGCNWRTGHWRPHWHPARRISRGARSSASLRRDAANCHGVPTVGLLIVGLPIVRKASRFTACGKRLLGELPSPSTCQPGDVIFRQDRAPELNQPDSIAPFGFFFWWVFFFFFVFLTLLHRRPQ